MRFILKISWIAMLILFVTGCRSATDSLVQEATEEGEPIGGGETAVVTQVPEETPAASAFTPGGQSIDDFFETSYSALLLRDPELLTEVGLDELYNIQEAKLTDISDAYIRETQSLERAILDELHTFDRSTLTPEQQLSYDVYEYFLEDRVRSHQFMYHNYPVTFFITSVQFQTQFFFTDLQPLTSKKEAEDYVARLTQVDTKFDQLIEGLDIRREMEIIPPKFVFQWTLPAIRQIADASAQETVFFTNFAEKIEEIEALSDEEKETLKTEAAEAIAASVIPAYQALETYLVELEQLATTDEGVWKLPDGENYYNYTLQHHTTTTLSADEIHQMGLEDLERIQAEMRLIFDELGYPQNESLSTLYGRVAQDSGFLSGQAILQEYEAIIDHAEQNVGDVFDLTPKADVVVIGVQNGGYYVRPSVDGSRPGAFYASAFGSEPRFAMPTLAYHEAIPGHHFQLAIMQELPDLPTFRKGASFTGYVEGWALYAERLAAELGFYDDDPYGDLGRLQAEAFRAARLVVDTGIHSEGWTFDEAVDYMVAETGLPQRMVQGQIARYIVWPGQATAYKIGMIKFVELRQEAEEQLGEQFDIKAFHNVVIGQGSLPLNVLEREVQNYISEQ